MTFKNTQSSSKSSTAIASCVRLMMSGLCRR
jgi:hypothetical protein